MSSQAQKISTYFSISFMLVVLVLILPLSVLYRHLARICDVKMSKTWIWVRSQAAIVTWQRLRPVFFFLLSHLFTYNFARFARFVSVVSDVSLFRVLVHVPLVLAH